MKKAVLLLACFFAISLIQAQSITGIWRGYFYSGLGFFQQQYKYEVQINQLKNKSLRGVTYSYNSTEFYGKAGLKGIAQNGIKSVIMKEDTLIEVRGSGGQTCLMTCYLDYTKDGKTEVLQGNYTSVVSGTGSDCGSGSVYLKRVDSSDFVKEDFLQKKPVRPQFPARPQQTTPLVKQLPRKPATSVTIPKRKDSVTVPLLPDTVAKIISPAPVPVPPALKERTNELVRTITTNSPDIKIDLYDNGEIDGDTITVYHNNKVMAYRKGLNTTPVTLKVTASLQDRTHEFVMYANNLGKIPPNTALMVITTGGKRYELSVSSTKEKNAKVVIEYQPEPGQ